MRDEKVTMTLPCPACGGDAVWYGTVTLAGGGTGYRIVCPACPQPPAEEETK